MTLVNGTGGCGRGCCSPPQPCHFNLILMRLVSIAVPAALLICIMARMLLLSVLRMKFLIRLGSFRRTFPIAPGGRFATLGRIGSV